MMTAVSKETFYAVINPLPRTDHGASMRRFPAKMMEWRIRQWRNSEYVLAGLKIDHYPSGKVEYLISDVFLDELIQF